jgi:hypothetical protein
MSTFVVDTNVPIVANGEADHVIDPKCVLASLAALRKVTKRGVLLLDSAGLILKEYRASRHLRLSGQPGAGDAFVKWAHDNQANPRRCRRIAVTPNPDDDTDFVEFPDDPALASFDRSDRKFVAVALASGAHPEILNATDTDWWHYREVLQSHGVTITFLCPDQMNRSAR